MNTLALLVAAAPWAASAPVAAARIFAAVGVFSIEMQLATLSGLATLRSLAPLNAALAVLALAIRRRRRDVRALPERTAPVPLPRIGVLLIIGLVATLNLALPLAAADPYHLQRVDQIERLGTLEYDPAADPKANILGGAYELVLADLRQIPIAGPAIVRMHGVLGVILLLLCVRAVRELLPGGPAWGWSVLLVVPVVFHQFVLVKNDLFGTVPALVALAWMVAPAPPPPRALMQSGWLAGMAVAMKLTMLPAALAVLAVGMTRAGTGRMTRAVTIAAAGAAGAAAGGFLFVLAQNARWYGDALAPFDPLGNRTETASGAVIGIARFAISLVDLGLATREWWPGRGGWAGTFGLPLIWALVVLLARVGEAAEARRALWLAGGCFLAFAAAYPDADLAHRLVLAPGLLVVAVAVHLVDGDARSSVWFRRALIGVIAASAAQIARSAALYLRVLETG